MRVVSSMQVIEYIQFLQGLIHSYEGTYQGWNPEASKLIPWVRCRSYYIFIRNILALICLRSLNHYGNIHCSWQLFFILIFDHGISDIFCMT